MIKMHEPLFDNPQYLEHVRLEILSNFAALLQFNLYIPSLSKNITVSISVVNSSTDQKTMEHLMSNVDSALYQAKEQGKDTVIIYGNTYEQQW